MHKSLATICAIVLPVGPSSTLSVSGVPVPSELEHPQAPAGPARQCCPAFASGISCVTFRCSGLWGRGPGEEGFGDKGLDFRGFWMGLMTQGSLHFGISSTHL